MAELFFIDGLQAEGLQHFDRLVGPPEFPIIDFRAAAACLITVVNDLKRRFLLLLSATAVGNNLTELYNLIQLLRPGLLQTAAQFRRKYGQIETLSQAGRRDRLRELLREVMVRNTRAHIDLKLPKRIAATHVVRPAPEEACVLDALAAVIRDRYNTATAAGRWRMTTLQMQAGSGPPALRFGLRDHAGQTDTELFAAVAAALDRIDGGRSTKIEALLNLARRSPEKKIVFTRFRATLEELDVALTAAGHRVSVFHGGLSSVDKQKAIDAFEHDSEVLLSTEVGGEGAQPAVLPHCHQLRFALESRDDRTARRPRSPYRPDARCLHLQSVSGRKR
jgi:SNF2 family DNA or RNA helicase